MMNTSLTSTTLANLNLAGNNLSGVPAELLATAVSHLHSVNLESTRLSTDQCTQIMNTSLTSTTLANLNLRWINLSGVLADILAMAVSHLKIVRLTFIQLTTNQSVKVLDIIPSSATLTNLDLWGNNLVGVPAAILAMAVGRLKTVNLESTQLTINQSVKVLDIIPSSATLNNLDLWGNNLSAVPADILAMVVGRLETVNLSYTQLTTNQCVKVLESIPPTRLTNLYLYGIDLSGVPADLLAKNVGRLKIYN